MKSEAFKRKVQEGASLQKNFSSSKHDNFVIDKTTIRVKKAVRRLDFFVFGLEVERAQFCWVEALGVEPEPVKFPSSLLHAQVLTNIN